MTTYFDTNIGQLQTALMLTMRGLPIDADFLRGHGIFQVTYMTPLHNDVTQTIEPDGEPQPNADGTAYVQGFTVVDRPLAEVRTAVKARVTAKRWEKETGGIDEPGYGRIFTGLDDQNRIATALVGIDAASATDTPILEVDFKGAEGWARISAEQVKAIAVIISTHVQACFSREKALHGMADAAETLSALQTMVGEIENGWPGELEAAQ